MNTTKKTIMIVDDVSINIKILSSFLRADYQLVIAKKGVDALIMVRTKPVDLILLDVMMPDMDGFEVCKRLKEDPYTQDIPIIFVTGCSSSQDIETGLGLDAYYYVTKPFEQKLLATIVHAALAHRDLEKALKSATHSVKDMLWMLESGRYTFRTLDDAYHLAVLLAIPCTHSEEVVVGLKELLLNAIEHGNLELSYEDKSVLSRNGQWDREIETRLNSTEYGRRRGVVEFERRNGNILFLITDQGKGFDWRPFIDFDPNRLLHVHGRGIMLARQCCFDRLEYQGSGNQVLAVAKEKQVVSKKWQIAEAKWDQPRKIHQTPTILVVDDVPGNIKILSEILKVSYRVLGANNGKDALEAVKKASPDLILLDILMPGMSGFDVCRYLKEDPATRDIAIIFLTGMTSSEDETKGLELGAVDYLTKPFVPSVILARVHVHLQLRCLNVQLEELNTQLVSERRFVEDIVLRMADWGESKIPNIRYLMKPVERTTGDLLLTATRPDGIVHCILGDITGHGLPAAVIGAVISYIFYSMTEKGATMGSIQKEINTHLLEKTPLDAFLAAIFLEVNQERKTLTIWNCAMPDAFLFRNQRLHQRIPSAFLPRGVLRRTEKPGETILFQSNDRLFFASDGLYETINLNGKMFGEQELEKILKEVIEQNKSLEYIDSALEQFRGGGKAMDDLTVMEWLL